MFTLFDKHAIGIEHFLLVKYKDNYKFTKFLVLYDVDLYSVFEDNELTINTDYRIIRASNDNLLYFCRALNKINVEFEEVDLSPTNELIFKLLNFSHTNISFKYSIVPTQYSKFLSNATSFPID